MTTRDAQSYCGLTPECIIRCARAVTRIDHYLQTNQKCGAYDQWLEPFAKRPSEHNDAFLFGKLVQAMFSGGMRGQMVDARMPAMAEAFHGWDVRWIASLSAADIEGLRASGRVIGHAGKLKAVIANAKRAMALISQYGRLGKYLAKWNTVPALASDLLRRFPRGSYLREVTVQDFLKNVGFDTAKPDRHLTRWLQRMQAIDTDASLAQVLAAVETIADAAKLSRPHFDAAIYLFCADRDDVIAGGVCGDTPACGRCPITDLCPRKVSAQVATPLRPSDSCGAVRTQRFKCGGATEEQANTVWATRYPGESLEDIRRLNPFACRSWLEQPFGRDGSWERLPAVEKLFAGSTQVDRARIAALGRNSGTYVAFRAIVHHHAIWENGLLRRVTPRPHPSEQALMPHD